MISIIIPVYKNKELFLSNFKHNYPFIKGNEIIIVNDDPEVSLQNDFSVYPQIILLENKENLGFGQSINNGVKKSSQDYLMLLNTDVLLENTNYQNTINLFKNDQTLFAVSFNQKERNGLFTGKNKIYWKNGFFLHKSAHNRLTGINAWTEGGSCIIDKKKMKEIGLFDPLFSPFYWEDVDLSYRAWKSGYKILFDSSIIVTHFHESTIRRYFSDSYIKTVAFRNQLIFIWKNIYDRELLFQHLIFLPRIIISHCLNRQWYAVKGFVNALLKLPTILAIRRKQKFIKTDREILNKFL